MRNGILVQTVSPGIQDIIRVTSSNWNQNYLAVVVDVDPPNAASKRNYATYTVAFEEPHPQGESQFYTAGQTLTMAKHNNRVCESGAAWELASEADVKNRFTKDKLTRAKWVQYLEDAKFPAVDTARLIAEYEERLAPNLMSFAEYKAGHEFTVDSFSDTSTDSDTSSSDSDTSTDTDYDSDRETEHLAMMYDAVLVEEEEKKEEEKK